MLRLDQDKVRGVVFGVAVGDAIGYPVEFLSRDQIREVCGGSLQGYLRLVDGVAEYSDDTQMFLAVLRGLLRAIGGKLSVDWDSIHLAVAEELIAWGKSSENNRAPGAACMFGVHNLATGVHWREAGKVHAGGCGAAMRSMAYALVFDVQAAWETARAHAAMTHRSPSGEASSAAVAAITGLLLRGKKPTDACLQGHIIARRIDPLTGQLIWEAIEASQEILEGSLSGVGPRMVELLDKWRGWTGHEAVAASVLCFLVSRSYREAVLWAVNSSGDSDSLGAITGAFAGAHWGFASIPHAWVGRIENRLGLEKIVESACEG
jgi:ADP-ribosylglycohydrolase